MIRKLMILAFACAVFMAGPAAYASGAEVPVKNPEFEYYQVPPLVLPVITEKGLVQQVSLAISLELPFGEKEDIAAYGPRLVDAYIRDMFGALGTGQVMMKGNVIDVEELKTRLEAVTERVLGEDKGKVKGLLLQAVQQHQI